MNALRSWEMIETQIETSRSNDASATNVAVVESFKKDTTVAKNTNIKEIEKRNKIKEQRKADRDNIRVHGKKY